MKGKKLITKVALSVMTIICVLLVMLFAFDNKNNSDNNSFNKTLGAYVTDKSELIDETGAGRRIASEYQRMNSLYNISSDATVTVKEGITIDSNKAISISSAEELFAFSQLCLKDDSFLAYDYALLNNIDYSKYDSNRHFYPVGCVGTPFSGTFNGNGYDITGLTLAKLTDNSLDGVYSAYANISYFSMFGELTGSISNLGLINTNIEVNASRLQSTLQYISPLVGLNKGEINYVYATDLRDAETEEAGITAAGAYQLSGLVSVNEGTLNNAYTAYSIISNHTLTTTVILWNEILLENKGSVSNLFFYDQSIVDGGYELNGTTEIVTYDPILVRRKLERSYSGATYISSLRYLNDEVSKSSSNWYTSASYGVDLESSLSSIVTPILRGLTYDQATKVFKINNEFDYMYMYELFNLNSYYASSKATYEIQNDIDLKYIPTDVYVYNMNVGCKIIGKKDDSRQSVKTRNGNYSKYPTIFNATTKNMQINEGYNCYGVFPWFTGIIEDLNFYFDDEINISPSSVSSNISAIGLVTGYAENGSINNVNTYGGIVLGVNIGRVYAGQIAGIAGGDFSITATTAAGKIESTNESTIYSNTSIQGNVSGSSFGGVVGFASDTYINLDDILSVVTITVPSYAASNNIDIMAGGVLGSGYVDLANKLENRGNIYINEGYYNYVYSAGVIGRILGVKQQINSFHNQGDITVNANYATIYLSGCVNADIQTTSGTTSASLFKNKASKYIFYASSFSNAGKLFVVKASATASISGVAMINSANGFISSISGFYNIGYKYGDDNFTKTHDNNPVEYNMKAVNSFGAVITSTATNSNGLINANDLFNFKSYKFFTSEESTKKSYIYSGCVNGSFVNGENLRNEGSMNFVITNPIGTSSAKLLIVGVMNEISEGCSLNKGYNAGNMKVLYSATINGDVYVSGICYANRNSFSATQMNQFNPISSDYVNNKTGSLNSVINAGHIEVSSKNFENITYADTTIKSTNGASNLGSVIDTSFADSSKEVYITGDLFTSGIVTVNESVITNTFNIGDITAANYIKNTSSEKEVNAGGISVLNYGGYAYILNSANDGNIKAINMSSGGSILANVNAAGITCRNDELENGNNYSGNASNSKQIISFTINYGSVYAYNYKYNITSTAQEPYSKAAGILAMGLCNIINVVNYGNIYGSETSSGIFGVVYFNKFQSEVNSDVYIANTLNYGNVYMLERGYNYIHGSTYPDYEYVKYAAFMSLDLESVDQYSFTTIPRNTDYLSIIGSVFSIVNFAESTKANNIKIRYLISFNDKLPIVGSTTAVPTSVSTDTTSFYSAYSTINAETGATELDSWMGKYVNYIPLTTSTETKTVVTGKVNGIYQTASREYAGAFSTRFAFRQATEGNDEYLDIANNPTDKFIADYFQFVGYKYVNENLLDVIGWRSIAYQTAANEFAQNIEYVYKVINISSGVDDLVADALKTDTWLPYASTNTISSIVDGLIESNDVEKLTSILSYVFSSESSSNVLITPEIRESIYNKIIENNSSINLQLVLSSVLNYENGYSKVLADSILNENDEIYNFINSYVNNLSEADLKTILGAYIEYLKQNSNEYFNYSSSEVQRYNILNSLLSEINDETFYSELMTILGITSGSSSATIGMYNKYNSFSDAQKHDLFNKILLNNSHDKLNTYLNSMQGEIGFFNELINNGYKYASMDAIYNSADINENSTAESSTIIDGRVELWNQIKDTNTFKNYFNNLYGSSSLLFKATEYNNTFQSFTEPHNDGAYLGDTAENRLSYLYTKEITPKTYFYGPYNESGGVPISSTTGKDLSTTTPGGYQSVFSAEDYNLFTSTDIMKSRGGVSSTTTFAASTTPSILMYYDLNNEQFGEATVSTTILNRTLWGFDDKLIKKSKKSQDPMTGVTYDTSDWSGIQFIETTDTITVASTGETFSLNKAKMSGIFYSGKGNRTLSNGSVVSVPNLRIYITDINGSVHPVYGNITVNGQSYNINNDSTNMKNIYRYITDVYGVKIYTSTATKTLHSTGRTGIYRFSQPWGDVNYFTWKQSNKNKVYTSQYIDYKAADILNLDGILTEYKATTVNSEDERYIINKMFTDYFLTSSNIESFKKMVRVALFETLGSSSNAIKFIDSFVNVNIYTSTLISGNTPFKYLNYTSSQTVEDYLTPTSSSTNNKQTIINAAVSDANAFAKLLELIIRYNDTTITQETYNAYKNLYNYVLDHPEYTSSDNIDLSSMTSESTLSTLVVPLDKHDDISVTLDNITGSDVKSVYSSSTYANRNNETITTNYGFTFSSITFATPTDYTAVKVVAKAVSESTTLSYSYDTVLDSVEVSTINTYSIPLSNTSSITLIANGDIVVYEIYFEKEIENIEYNKGATLTSANVAVGYYAMRISAPTTAISNSISIKNLVYMDGTTVTSKNDNPDQYTANQVWYYDGEGLKNVGTGLYIGKNDGLVTSSTPLALSFEFKNGYIRIKFDTEYLYYNGTGNITTGTLNGRSALEMYLVSKNIYYTYEYTDFLSNSSIKVKRLQSVELPKVSELRDGIIHYDYLNSNNQNVLYNEYLDSVTKHLAPIDVDNTNNISNPFINSMSEANQNELARLLIRNYNSALLSFISSTCTSKNDLSVVYEALINTEGGYYYLSDAIDYANKNSYLTNDFKKLLVAGYITADYANLLATGVNLYNSKMNTLLSKIIEGYRYINSDSSFDNNKFEALCNDSRIAYPLGTTGYGIYALASSKGILNGEFIPDNLALDSMDASYNKNVEVTEETEVIGTLYPIEHSSLNSGWSSQDITWEFTTNAISSVIATSSKSVTISYLSGSNIIQYGEYQFDRVLDLKGSGDITGRSLKVTVPNKSVLTVFAVSGSSSQNRILGLKNSSFNEITSFETTASVGAFSYEVEAGTYYLASNNSGIKIYGLLLGEYGETTYYPTGNVTIELTENLSSSWRGDRSNPESVQYAFDIEMKQLVKSISTSIFTLDLIAADQSVLYSSESSIDLENKTITYYVPTGFNLNGLTIDTYSMSLANRATLFLKGTEVKKGQPTSTFNLSVGTNTGLIRVYAEETSVYADYAIIIVESDFSFDLNEINGVLSGELEVLYKDSIIELEVTSPSVSNPDSTPLPGNLDLTPYISIQTLDGVIMDNAYELLVSPIIDSNGSTKIKMEILQTLPTGTYDIVVEIFNVKKTYRFIKNPSKEHDILEFMYEGVNYINEFNLIDTNTYQLDSTVKFGRAFTKSELSDYTSDDFYLNSIKYSSGATLSVEVSDPSVGSDDLMTYIITYTVTAEDLSYATYIHKVKEAAPYTVGSQYVSVFQDGVQSDTLSKNYQNNEKDNEVIFEIERGTTPINRVRYNLGGFYSFGNIDYSYESHSDYQSGAVTVSILTAGMSVVSSTTASAGDYSYNYIYTSSALWDGEGSEYERKYTFPTVTLSIIASRDATLHKITFISSASKLSTLSTVMHPSNVIRPTGDDLVAAENEISYKYLSGNPTANLINVTTDGIDYHINGDDMGYADRSIKDYYIVGSVSNVNLSSYAPTFTIESMANIYQYTTLEKLQKYGLGKQDADKENIISDKTILSNHDTTYIYVLYESGAETRVFLVELDENNNWVRAYNDTWDGNLSSTSYSIDSKTHAITCDGKNYTVSPLSGTTKAGNKSLYMNYIGSPLPDSDGDDTTDNSHFWYVSYAVFSEAALVGVDNEAVKYYHVAMIDLENTNLFVFEIKTPTDFTNTSIYLTLVYKIYNDKNEYVETKTLSIFADYYETVDGFRIYKALYNITLLPRAYYYFNLSLPGGYSATYEITNGKVNTNKVIEDKVNEEGAYLPPASIIIQEIDITITLYKAPNVSDDVWGLGTVGKYNISATFKKEE